MATAVPPPSGPGTGAEVDVPDLLDRASRREPRALGRLVSLLEDDHPAAPQVLDSLPRADSGTPRRARQIGLTGSPGVGKSTTLAALVKALRDRDRLVAVLAIDPSSPYSGGALLGDRIRLNEHALDRGVFIRSMSARGHLGGLSVATPRAVHLLEACGFDDILIETVGVGQSEVDIAGQADTTLVLVAPGMGDGIQAAKAGILEVGDILVVNKADRDGAAATARELRQMVSLGPRRQPEDWRTPVVLTSADRGTGVEDLMEEIDRHTSWLTETGLLEQRRATRARREIEAAALTEVRRRLAGLGSGRDLDAGVDRVLSGHDSPHAVAAELLARIDHHRTG